MELPLHPPIRQSSSSSAFRQQLLELRNRHDTNGKFPCVSFFVDWRDILISDRGQRIDSGSEESRHLISSQHVLLIFYLDDLLAARDSFYTSDS